MEREKKYPINGKGYCSLEKYELYYESGEIEQEGYFSGQDLSGVWLEYHKNGKIRSIKNYNEGFIDGFWNLYDENGKLFIEMKIEMDKQIWSRQYRENGKLEKEVYYFKRRGFGKHGQRWEKFEYYKTGELKRETQGEWGQEKTYCKCWDINGNEIECKEKNEFDNGLI